MCFTMLHEDKLSCGCLQGVNGVGGANVDQDTENTELMAIYTKDNQGVEKVT